IIPFCSTNLEMFPACWRFATEVAAGTSTGGGGGGADSGVGTLGRPRPLWAVDPAAIDKIRIRVVEIEQMPRVSCNVLLLFCAMKMIDARETHSQFRRAGHGRGPSLTDRTGILRDLQSAA